MHSSVSKSAPSLSFTRHCTDYHLDIRPEQILSRGVCTGVDEEGTMPNFNRRRTAKRLQSQINITPLIDVLLVLIVIFMVITPVTPKGLDADIPGPASHSTSKSKPQQDTLVLTVDKSGTITINHDGVNSLAELSTKLYDILRTRNDRTVFVQGAGSLDFDVVAHVIDTAIGSGASRIGLLADAIH